jgi:hypothetical protein
VVFFIAIYHNVKKAFSKKHLSNLLIINELDRCYRHQINDIAADANGGVWIAHAGQAGSAATLGGVDYLPNGFSTLYHFNDLMGSFSLPSSNVITIDIDQNGTIWAGCGVTYSGTYKAGGLAYKKTRSSPFTNSGFTNVSSTLPQGEFYTASTGDSRQVISIGCKLNEIWVGRSGSAYNANPFVNSQIVRYDTSGSNRGSYIWQNYSALPFSQKIVPSALYTDINGNGWCGIYNYNLNSYGGFCVFKNGVWSYINNASMPTVFPANAHVNANAIWGDDLGQVFIGTTKGLIIYDGEGSPTDPASYTRFNCISNHSNILGGCIDDDGDVWLATPNSVVKFEGAETLSVLGAYNIDENDNSNNYEVSRRQLGVMYCVNSVGSIDKVAADGSESTLFKIMSPEIGRHKIRIKTVGNTEPDKYGSLRELANPNPNQANDSIRVIYRHPTYKDATTPDYVEFECYEPLTNTVDVTFKVQVKRPPVLLLHGVNSNGLAMAGIKTQLLSTGFYDNYQVVNPSYPNVASFASNTTEIIALKKSLANDCLSNHLSFGKIDFIGHSMGGILSRLYLQNVDYNNDMHKIITINTPHSGSQLATRGIDFANFLGAMAGFIERKITNAIADKIAFENLQVNSSATLSLLNWCQ